MTTYKIVRFFQDPNIDSEAIEWGLSLEEAQAHCQNPETSSTTATSYAATARTEQVGAWFDGYTEE